MSPKPDRASEAAKASESSASQELAGFCADLTDDQVPDTVKERILELFVDWAGSAFSGKGHRAVEALHTFARTMGPSQGDCEILISRGRTSPMFAALVNAAASHVSEQDDVHNGSVFHPATVVFPAALAAAQQTGATRARFLLACIAGYEAGIRVGEFLGRSHYEVFHTTGTAGTIAAAAATGHILSLDRTKMLHAFGSAGTQSAGLWEFLRDAADSKQLHTAHASSCGLMAAYLAKDGFTGANRILEGKQGMAAGMSRDADVSKLDDWLGSRWGVLETSFKYHASCRHTHPAADALKKLIGDHQLTADRIAGVTAHVHQAAIDVLGAVTVPKSVHQAKFSMGATLGLIAVHGRAGMAEYEKVLSDQPVLDFSNRVTMELDPEIDGAYPARWIGKVSVVTTGGETLQCQVDEPKGDPGNTLSAEELDAKAQALALLNGAVKEDEIDAMMKRLWEFGDRQDTTLFPL